jgi:glyoxylase-like metal-dependent hydrolase (beta-lactamase superfamily II)
MEVEMELPALSYYRTAGDFSPIPPTCYDATSAAAMDAIGAKGYFTREIRDGVHIVTEGWYLMLVVVHDDGLIVVDAPPTIGPDFLGGNILKAIADVSDKPITHVVYSHHHRDHIGSANLYATDAVVIAHRDCAARLRDAADPQRPVPTVEFDDSYTLDVGGQQLRLDYHGDIHSPGNLFIHAPAQRILMNVDVVFPGWVPFSSIAMASNLHGFLRGHDVILGYDFGTFVPGHLSRLGTRDDVEIQRAYFQDLVDTAMKYLDEVSPARSRAGAEPNFMTAAELAGGFQNAWLVFDTYLNAVAEKVTAEVLPRWVGKLGAVDVFTRSHAWEVVERLRIDA